MITPLLMFIMTVVISVFAVSFFYCADKLICLMDFPYEPFKRLDAIFSTTLVISTITMIALFAYTPL